MGTFRGIKHSGGQPQREKVSRPCQIAQHQELDREAPPKVPRHTVCFWRAGSTQNQSFLKRSALKQTEPPLGISSEGQTSFPYPLRPAQLRCHHLGVTEKGDKSERATVRTWRHKWTGKPGCVEHTSRHGVWSHTCTESPIKASPVIRGGESLKHSNADMTRQTWPHL